MFFPGFIPGSGIAELYGSSVFSLRNFPTVFITGCVKLTFSSTVHKGSFSPHPPTFAACRFFDDSHSDRWEVKYCCFDLPFSN